MTTLRLIATTLFIAALSFGCRNERPEAMIDSAKAFLKKDDAKAAIIELKNALQKDPNSAEARYLLGIALLDRDDPTSAEKELRKAKDLGYPADQIVPRLARCMLELRQSKQLLDEFGGTQLTTKEANAELGAVRGYAFLTLAKLEDAQQSFATALSLQPNQPFALLGEARLKVGKSDLGGATKIVDGILATSPGNLEALFFKAELFVIASDRSSARKVYDTIIASRPDSLRAHTNRVTLSLMSEDLATAETQLAALKKIALHNPQTNFFQAWVSLKRKDLPAAREAILQVLKVAPDYMPARLLAAEVEFRLGSLAQAQQHLQRIVEEAPGNTAAIRMLAVILLQQGQPSRALETIKPLLSSSTQDAGLLTLAGNIYLGNSNLEQAGHYFTRAAEADSSSASARTRLGQVLFAGGDVVGGLHQLGLAASLDPAQYQADIMLITAHIRRKEVEKALAAVANLEKKQPKNPLTYYLRAAVAAMKDDDSASRKDLEYALTLDPVYFPAALALAKLDLKDKQLDSARRRFERILEKDPKNPQAMLAMVQVRRAMNAPASEIAEMLGKAARSNPGDVDIRLSLVRFYMSEGDFVKAASAALEANAAIANNALILEALGTAQQSAGETNQALATFLKAVALNPQSPEPLLRLAAAQAADRRDDAALQSLRKALALRPDFLEAQFGILSIYGKSGRTEEAIAVAKQIQRQRPKSSAGYLAEGDAYVRQKKWTQAATSYRAGLDHAPDTMTAVYYHSALISGGRIKEAASFASEWKNKNAQDNRFRSYLAERSLGAKQYELAAAQYKEILQAEPKNALILNNLAWAASKLNDTKALEYAEEANKLLPNNPAILDTLGTLLSTRGDAARSIELLRQAAALAPNTWAIRINLATALSKAGQRDAAKKELEPVLKLESGNPARLSAEELQRTL